MSRVKMHFCSYISLNNREVVVYQFDVISEVMCAAQNHLVHLADFENVNSELKFTEWENLNVEL
jgi:hypothetical protein